jgi:hypothetical protein
MLVFTIIAGILTILGLGYLGLALFKPEWF